MQRPVSEVRGLRVQLPYDAAGRAMRRKRTYGRARDAPPLDVGRGVVGHETNVVPVAQQLARVVERMKPPMRDHGDLHTGVYGRSPSRLRDSRGSEPAPRNPTLSMMR